MSKLFSKGWQVLAILLAVSLVAVACGSDEAETSTGDDTPATTAAPADDGGDDEPAATTAAPADDVDDEDEVEAMAMISDECNISEPAEETSIDLFGWEFPVTAAYADEAEECNSGNLSVSAQLIDSAAAQEQITLDLSTGSPAFEIIMTTDSTVGQHAANLVDLTPFIEKYRDEFDLDDISDTFWNGSAVDGKILGVPLDSNTMHFFYNTEIFAANGLTPPDNYDEVIAACGVLQEAGFDDPFNINLSATWSWEIEFSNMIKSLGGDILNDDNSPAWNSPEGLEAVNKLVEISDACMTDAGRSFGIDDSEAGLRAGELPMATIWASRAAQMDDPENSLVVDLIEFLPSIRTTPDSLRNGPAFIDFYSIPAGGEVDPELIFKVIMAATDLESQNAAAAHAAVARSSATNVDAPRNGAASQVSVAEGIGARRKSVALPVAQGFLGDALLEITASGADPAAALADSEAAYIEEATEQGLM
jgi:multiple sugar transport system substrate-binding protein